MSKVSVIIPCYNVEKYIERCLDSVCNQTLKDIEIICIDDCSTDDTLKIIKKYKEKDERINLIELKENSGAAIARNKGLEVAKGKYIGFVDPDDYVDKDFYEKLYNVSNNKKFDIIVGKILVYDCNNNKEYINNINKTIQTDGIASFSSCFWAGIYNNIFLKKHKIKFPDQIRYSQDCVFLTNVTLFAKNVFCVDNTYYHYFYQRPNSLDSEKLSHQKAISKYNAFKMNLDFINNVKFDDISKKYNFIKYHVLQHINYEIYKTYDDDNDRKKMFDLLKLLSTEYLPKKYFKKDLYKYIKHNKYKEFVNSLYYTRSKHYLFCFIPVLYIYMYKYEQRIKLLKFIPLLKIKFNRLYLFNFLPIWLKEE